MSLVGPIFGIISTVLILASGPSYFLSTIRGETKPHRGTWFIWALLGSTAFISQAALGASWSLLFTGVDSLGSTAMFVLSLRYGVGGWTVIERVALVIAMIGIAASVIVRQPLVALIAAIIADVCGYALTIVKAYKKPSSEDVVTWTLIAFSALCGVVAVDRFQLDLLLFPFYLAIANFAVVASIMFGRRSEQLKS